MKTFECHYPGNTYGENKNSKDKNSEKSVFKPGITEENESKKLGNQFGNSERVIEA